MTGPAQSLSGSIYNGTLDGTEILSISGATVNTHTTTADIAALAQDTVLPPIKNTAITTVGAGVLTAAGLVGGLITRSGSVAAFSDATDTAVAIVAALAAYVANESMLVRIKNTTNFPETITAGVGVTLTGAAIIPANSVGTYLMTIVSPTAVTLLHVETGPRTTLTPEVITALTTVGAGTVTAAGIAGRVTARSGAQSNTAFSDTTDIADTIIAAIPNANIGAQFEWTYVNGTNAAATLGGGTGVTVSGVTVIPAGQSVRYLVTYTATSTVTITAIDVAQAGTVPINSNITRCTTQLDKTTSAALANVVGLLQTVAIGTYKYRIVLSGTAGASGGWKVAFKYTTAVASVINALAEAFTASAVAVALATTTTDQASLLAVTAANIGGVIEGTIIFTTGGTVQLQFAQNVSDGTTCSIFVGSTMEFTRIA